MEGMRQWALVAGSEGMIGTLGDLTGLGCTDVPLTVAACMLWTLPLYCDDDAAVETLAAAAVRSPEQPQTDAAETTQAMRRSALQPLMEALDALQAGSSSPSRLASFVGGLTAVRTSRVADAARLALLFCRDSLATLTMVLQRGDAAAPSTAVRIARQLHAALMHVLQVRGNKFFPLAVVLASRAFHGDPWRMMASVVWSCAGAVGAAARARRAPRGVPSGGVEGMVRAVLATAAHGLLGRVAARHHPAVGRGCGLFAAHPWHAPHACAGGLGVVPH
jgi:hypothetical protein